MSNLPTSTTAADLPACGEPATTRIELFAARDGRAHGSLDGVMYLCDRHADEFVEAANWDSTGTISPHRTALTDRDILCGTGWDFVAGKAIESERAAAAVLGDGHPIVETAVDALTFGGWVDIADIPRDRAALLLDCWAHRRELSDREVKAILARFPERDEVEREKVHTDNMSSILEAYRLGQAIGRTEAGKCFDETLALAQRIDRRLKAAATKHAFTVAPITDHGMDDWLWSCTCGDTIPQLQGGTDDIRRRLQAHLKAKACGCPFPVPDQHEHRLFLQRHPETGASYRVVVQAVWTGSFQEVQAWPWAAAGLEQAQVWCDEHRTVWEHSGYEVRPGSLAVHAPEVER